MELNLENLPKTKTFNMVNMHNKQLLALGLEPSIIRLNPLYINLQRDIFYAEVIDKIYWHKEGKLDRCS